MKWNNTIKNSKKITIILDNIIFYVFIANFVLLKLIKKSNSRGGTDNISIAYLKKESGDL